VKKSDGVADEATKLTLKISKFCWKESPAAVVMACAGMIGYALALLPPQSRKIVRAALNAIIDDCIDEWKK
jgi:hypothetical protein